MKINVLLLLAYLDIAPFCLAVDVFEVCALTPEAVAVGAAPFVTVGNGTGPLEVGVVAPGVLTGGVSGDGVFVAPGVNGEFVFKTVIPPEDGLLIVSEAGGGAFGGGMRDVSGAALLSGTTDFAVSSGVSGTGSRGELGSTGPAYNSSWGVAVFLLA